jgi:hypothetical protein
MLEADNRSGSVKLHKSAWIGLHHSKWTACVYTAWMITTCVPDLCRLENQTTSTTVVLAVWQISEVLLILFGTR